jgi:predicted nuclease of predicted toxin-antitoxin system
VKIRFQADADLNEDIVKGVLRREPGIDFRTATFAGLRGLSDLEVLKLAAQDGRVLVSHDRKTMPHALVAIERILLAWITSDTEEWVNGMAAILF